MNSIIENYCVFNSTFQYDGLSDLIGSFGYCVFKGNGVASKVAFQNCYYSVFCACVILSDDWRDDTTEKDLSALTLYNLLDSYKLSSKASHPVLKAFDYDISNFIRANTENDIKIKLDLNRTLNVQGQNDIVKLYLGNALLSYSITVSGTVTIPKATLNNLAIGEYIIKFHLVSDTNEIVKTSNTNIKVT